MSSFTPSSRNEFNFSPRGCCSHCLLNSCGQVGATDDRKERRKNHGSLPYDALPYECSSLSE